MDQGEHSTNINCRDENLGATGKKWETLVVYIKYLVEILIATSNMKYKSQEMEDGKVSKNTKPIPNKWDWRIYKQ